MHFIKAIGVVISGIFTTAMADALMLVAPRVQPALDVVRIRVHTRAWCNRRLDQRRDRHLWNVFQQPNDPVTATLDHPEKRRLLGGKRAPSPLALEPSAPSAPPFFATSSGLPGWPATM
jgi:hypothetical protein